jgi:hypothetical protein
MEHTEIKDASVLVGQAILVLRRKFLLSSGGLTVEMLKLKFCGDTLAKLLPKIERAERAVEGK